LLNVAYKGVSFLTNFATPFTPSEGRLVLAGRVGGANQHQHIDNLSITTIPADAPIVGQPAGNAAGFRIGINDAGPFGPDTNTIDVYLNGTQIIDNGANIAAGGTISLTKVGITTFIAYQNMSQLLVSGSGTNVFRVTFSGTGYSPVDQSRTFSVPAYNVLNNAQLAPAAVNTSLQGFVARTVQTARRRHNSGNPGNADNLITVERQMAGGFLDPSTGQPYPNTADLSLADANGRFTISGQINLEQAAGLGGNEAGLFTSTANPPQNNADAPIPGIPGTDFANVNDNIAMEILTILDLTPGNYMFAFGHDDGFALIAGAEPRDTFASTLLGSNNGTGSEDLVHVVVTNAGKYPMRILFAEGGGGAHLEFFRVNALTAERVLVNDLANSGVAAYSDSNALTRAYIQNVQPAQNETQVSPIADIIVRFQDGSAATVNDGSIDITVNGIGGTEVISNVGGQTTARLPNPGLYAPASTNVVQIVYSTSAGGPFTNSYTFTAAGLNRFLGSVTLPTGLRTPVGSADAAQPGFKMKAWQVPPGTTGYQQNRMGNNEQLLTGLLVASNFAKLSRFTNNNYFVESNVLNYANNAGGALFGAGSGYFIPVNSYAEAHVPYIIGDDGTTNSTADNGAMEIQTFVEFASPGNYLIGFDSDDGWRLTLGDRPGPDVGSIKIIAPPSLRSLAVPGAPPNTVGNFPAFQSMVGTNAPGGPFGNNFGSGFNPYGAILPKTPIIKRCVAADPLFATNGVVNNASDLAGNIAIIQRHPTVANDTIGKIVACKNAGAVAIIVCVHTGENAYLPQLSGNAGDVQIPVLFVGHAYGTNLVNASTSAANSPVILRIGDDSSFSISEYNGGRGANTADVYRNINVSQAGVYPMRLLWFNGGGDAAVEWWTENGQGLKVPVNATNSPIKTYRARTVTGGPPSITSITSSGNSVSITWTGIGELEEAFSVTGPWQKSPYQSNPAVVPVEPLMGGASFFRVRQY
jgi:hypothetical protein